MNVIPADTRNKTTNFPWGQWQEKAIPQEIHDYWKRTNTFGGGLAVILGKAWHRHSELYLWGIDADNQSAIDAICRRNGKYTSVNELSRIFIVEQHEDDPTRLHIYGYSKKPYPKICAGVGICEVKSEGIHGIMYCTNSIHKNGHRYQILGTLEPTINEELLEHIFRISGYGKDYNDGRIPVNERAKQKHYAGTNRHEELLVYIESLLFNDTFMAVHSEEEVKQYAHDYNNKQNIPPLDYKEFEKQWKSATDFVARKKKGEAALDTADEISNEYSQTKLGIEQLAAKVMETHALKTVMDTEEIYYYTGGIYRTGGEQIIKITLEEIAGYSINGHKRREIIDHIKYRTMIKREHFDCDPNIMNVKNGLLDMNTGARTDHNPQFPSLVQLPVAYDKKDKCPNIMKFLAQALHPQDFFKALQIIGYCLYKSSKYEKAIMLFGGGSNGKGVFIKLIEALVGLENTSHVELQDIGAERFAAADMFGKSVNTFADLKQERLCSTGMFKALVSGDSIRAQKKYGQPFSFRNYAKLIFSTNKIPESDDRSYAYYRRWVILCFDEMFEGKMKDTDLIDKLTTPEELSGLLNLALIALKQLHQDGGFKDVSVERVKNEYDSKANIIAAFLKEECVVDLTAPEYYTLTTDVYSAYVLFCNTRGEKSLEPNIFGKKLAEQGIEKERSRYRGDRDYYYMGLKLRADLRGINQALN